MIIHKNVVTFIFCNFLLFTGFFWTSCDEASEDISSLEEEVLEEEVLNEPEDPIESRLISAEKKVTKTSGNLRIVFNSSGLDLPLEQFLYDVQIWKVIYETSYKGEKIMASGMAYIPVMDSVKFSYHVFAHGTITANRDAPSELPLNDFQNLLFAGMASTGLITVVPDFIGFGISRDIMHPYYVEEMSALAVIDELRAVRELLVQEEVNSDGELYLSGYSQGGYVAMAAHKYIEENDLEYFDLKASFPSSGGYDMKGVRDFFFDQEVYETPYFMAYVAESYRTYYDFDTAWASQIFNEPYDQIVTGIFNGITGDVQINSRLNDTVAVLITPEFLSDPDNEKFSEISQLFYENSLLDWVPQNPMYLFHGDIDFTVPYQNSVDTYDAFLAAGGSPDIITLITFEGKDHYTSPVLYIESYFNTIMKLEGY
jgi:pimeloyl-ACP methyl ester carboxylesterase